MEALSPQDKQIIEKFTTQLRKKLADNLVLVKLYGSRARGDWRQDSDIDIFIVVKKLTGRVKEQIQDITWQTSEKNNARISPVIYSLNNYLDNTHPLTSFMYHIQNEGKEIYAQSQISNQLE